MPVLKWSKSMELGIRQIDEQHLYLVDIANEFIKAVKDGQTDEVIQATVARLREYTVRHFHDEEAYLEKIRYPARNEQEVAHSQLVRQVKQYQRDIYKRRDITPEQIRDFLRGWLIEHILNMDLGIAEWVREQERIKAEPEAGKVQKGKQQAGGEG